MFSMLPVAPAGDLSTYVGPALCEETMYRTMDGKAIIYRRHIAGDAPVGQSAFWFNDVVGLKTPQGVQEIPVHGPLPAETLAEALAVYNDAVNAEGKRAVEDIKAAARRAALSGG